MRTASWLLVVTCGSVLVTCKTTDEHPPTVVLSTSSESRTPIYDNLSPPDRDEADRILRGCRDLGGGCSDSLLQLDTGAPSAMAVAEGVCGDGRADVCARLALLHLRGVARGTSRAEGLRLLDVACQRRLADACLNLALALGDEPGTEHREEIRRLAHFACTQGLNAGCAIEEPQPSLTIGEAPPPLKLVDGGVADGRTTATAPAMGAPPASARARFVGQDLTALLAPGRVLLLGALFGTREAPAELARVTHASAQAGPTVLALDIEVQETDRLQRFLRSPGDARSIDQLLQGFWLRPYQDGRSSQAVLGMLRQVRGDVARGLPLTALPIDLPLQGDAHTDAFANVLAGLLGHSPSAVVIALLGNRQAARVALTLRKRGIPLVSVHLAHDGGEAWICQSEHPDPFMPVDSGGDPIERLRELSCREANISVGPLNRRPHLVDALPFVEPGDTARAISVRSRTDGRRKLYAGNFARDGYDYVFPLGVVSASRPAVPEKR